MRGGWSGGRSRPGSSRGRAGRWGGEALAQRRTRQLTLLAENAETLQALQLALQAYNRSLGSGGDRVCVHLQGHALDLTSARMPEMDADITPQFKQHEFLLVTSAAQRSWKQVLEGK